MFNNILAFLVPLLISFIATPFAKKIAHMAGAIDVPKDDRRIHKKPIPRLGGLAIYIATVTSTLIFMDKTSEMIGILAGGTIIAITGIADDIKPMSAKLKMLLQIVAAGVLIYSGIKIEIVTNPFSDIGYFSLGMLSVPITLLWIVGITNAVNLIDGLDGLSAGVSAISALSLAAISYMAGDNTTMVISLIIAGSALGFLPYNFNPASIFMGDTGALFLGFVLSAVSIEGAVKSATTVAIIVPLLALGLPIFDTTFAMLRRYKNKRPIMEADRGHLHHRLLDIGFGQRRTVIILYTINALFGTCAIVMYRLSFLHSLIFLLVIFTIVVTGMFKLRALGRKIRNR